MKHTWSLILLFVTALLLMTGYSLLPASWREPLGLRAVSAADYISVEWQEEATPKTETPAPDTVAKADVMAEDTTAQRVLIVGDSMVERLRRRMARYCHASGHELTSVIWYSSSTEWWSMCDTLQHFIDIVQPTHIYICLGGNELYVRDLDHRAQCIAAVHRMCGDIPTVWIGPPNWCEDTGINELICREMGSDAYYPSYQYTYERASDKHHPTQAAADKWMDSIAAWTNRHQLVHPIRYIMPTDQSAQHQTYIIAPEPPQK